MITKYKKQKKRGPQTINIKIGNLTKTSIPKRERERERERERGTAK